MTRLYDALQRAELMPESADAVSTIPNLPSPPDQALASEFNREGHTVIPPQNIVTPTIVADQPAAVAAPAVHGVVAVCPFCAAPCHDESSGWTKAWARVSRSGRFRCRACNRRFQTARRREPVAAADEPASIPGFLTAEDTRSFQELIQDLARDERHMRDSLLRQR